MQTEPSERAPATRLVRSVRWAVLGLLAIGSLAGRPLGAETWFGPPVIFAMPELAAPLSVGRLNSDAYIDLAVGGRTGDTERVYVVLNDGAGQFTISTVLPVTNQWNDLEVGDFNGDGRDDIAVCDDPLNVYFADEAHTYHVPSVPITWPNSRWFYKIAVADVDADGFDDLAGIYPGSANGVLFLPGAPTGFLTPPMRWQVNVLDDTEPWYENTQVDDVLLRDMDGDGDLDIALSCETDWGDDHVTRTVGIGYIEQVGEREFAENPRWVRKTTLGSPLYWEQFDVADLTGDQLPDALYKPTDADIRMLVGTQSGPWIDRAVTGVGSGRPYLHDMDGDGEADVLKKTTFTYEVYRGGGASGFEWIQSIPQPPGWHEMVDLDGLPGPELVGSRSSPPSAVFLPNLTALGAGVVPLPGRSSNRLEVAPSLTSGGTVTVRLRADARGHLRPAIARVIDARGARCATIELRLATGGGQEGALRTDASWARSGSYWIDVPGENARAQRLTIVR